MRDLTMRTFGNALGASFTSTLACEIRQTATLPLILGGIGLRSADRLRVPAFWASWADCLPMIQNRHPDVAGQLIAQLEGRPDTPIMRAASDATLQLNGVRDFVPPSWRALADGARPQIRDIDDFERGNSDGWQHVVASRTDEVFRERMFASMRSQGGSGAGLALSCSSHLSGYEAGSPALPCDPSPPSPVAPSLHRAFLQVWPPTRLIGPPPSSVRKGSGFGQEGMGSRERRCSHLP